MYNASGSLSPPDNASCMHEHSSLDYLAWKVGIGIIWSLFMHACRPALASLDDFVGDRPIETDG